MPEERTATGEDGTQIRRLCAALRAANAAPTDDAREFASRVVDRAAAPLIDRLYQPLFRYCRSLVHDAPLLRERLEPEDLAQDAWLKMLRYLSGPNGARVADDAHFVNLLYGAALNLFKDRLDHFRSASAILVDAVSLDAADSPSGTGDSDGGTRGDRLAAGDAFRADRSLILGDDDHLEMIALLFRDPRAFRDQGRIRVYRGLPRYRAFVLLQLGVHLIDDLANRSGPADAAEFRILRALVDHLGIPPNEWDAVEAAALDFAVQGHPDTAQSADAARETLFPVIRAVCGVDLKSGNALAVIRYDLNAWLNGVKP